MYPIDAKDQRCLVFLNKICISIYLSNLIKIRAEKGFQKRREKGFEW